jgi:hypothetical protein
VSFALKAMRSFFHYARYSVEFWLLVAVLIGALFWSGTPSGRSFWGDMACKGYLFPKHIEDGSVVKSEIEGAAEQYAAFATASQRLGANQEESRAIGKSAAILCNQPTKGN